MPKAWLIGGAATLSTLLVASIVLGLTQQATEFEVGSPEQAVQSYLTAADEDDYQTAHDLLSKELRDQCPMRDFAAGSVGGRLKLDSRRVTYEETKYVEDTAVVITRVANVGSGGPFGTTESSYEQRFTLDREDGEWKLSGQPWPFYGCPGPVRVYEPAESMAPAPALDEPSGETSTPADKGP